MKLYHAVIDLFAFKVYKGLLLAINCPNSDAEGILKSGVI